MKKAFFALFLAIFAATALVTLLGIVGWLPIDKEYLTKLFYLLIVEVVASVIALFKETDFFGEKSTLAGLQENQRFCERAAGYWWSSGADPDSLGFAHIAHDKATGMLRVVGTTYNPDGEIIATWNDRASCFDPKRKTLYYSWEGHWKPTEPYEGFAELRFDDSIDNFNTGQGVFSDRNLTDVKSITMKSSYYRRCSEPEVKVMTEGDGKRIGTLVRSQLNIKRDNI